MVGTLIAVTSILVAVLLRALLRERYWTDCGGDILGLLCVRERRPSWIDPFAIGILTAGFGLALLWTPFGRRLACQFGKSGT